VGGDEVSPSREFYILKGFGSSDGSPRFSGALLRLRTR
jgi:hypothetical protein